MCESCLIVNEIADEISALVPCMKSNRDDELFAATIQAIPALHETGFTVEHFNQIGIFELAGLIAIRCARAVASSVPGQTPGTVLAQWAEMAMQGELSMAFGGGVQIMAFDGLSELFRALGVNPEAPDDEE